MSVSQFPNAKIKTLEEIFACFKRLAPNPDPSLDDEMELTVSAHICVACEQILKLQKMAPHLTQDPGTVRKIKALLDSCR